MRKIYSFLLAVVACVWSASVSADITVTINIDDINRVTVGQYDVSTYDYPAIEGLKTGANVLTFADAVTLKVLTQSSDYGINSITYVQGANKGSIEVQYGAYINISDAWDGAVFTITSFSYADLRTAKCKVYVDDASKVSLQRNYVSVALEDGLNIVPFIPSGSNAENSFAIRGNGSLYKVKLNGEEQSSYGTYYLTVADGDSLTILANFPDVDVPVHFVAGNAASAGFITAVKVDGTAVSNWADADFTVKLGSNVEFSGNVSDYQCDSLIVDGTKTTYFSGTTSFFVGKESDYTIKYYAAKYQSYDVTINIDNPAAVSAYKYSSSYFSSYSATPITLQAGANVVSFNTSCKYLFIKTNAGSKVLTFVDADNQDFSSNTIGSYPTGIATADGAVYTITTWTVDRSSTLAFYIDDPAAAQHGGQLTLAADNYNNMSQPLVFQNPQGASVLAQSGYNLVKFDPEFDNPAQVSFYVDDASTVNFYINGEKQEASTTFSGITLSDGDVLKAYLLGTPAEYSVSFASKEGSDFGFTDVVRDVIVPVSDVSAPLSVLTDTQISFRLSGTTLVTANGKALVADEDGVYTLSINENTAILAGGEPTGIANAAAADSRNVYSLQGVLLLQDATEAQIQSLPAGMYIIGGKTTYLLQH